MRSRALASVVVAAVALATSPALADEADARARASRSFEEARSAFGRRDFAAAAAAFEQAAELVPHPATWLNASEAWEELADYVHSAEDCDRALAIKDIAPALRSEADARLARVTPRIATLELHGDRTVTVAIDGGEAQSLPRKRRLVPGSHRLVVTDVTTGRERTQALALATGSMQTIDVKPFAPAASTASAAPVETQTRTGPPVASIVAFGAAGLFAGGSALFGVRTVAAKDDFDAVPNDTTLDSFQREKTITNVLLGAAVVAAVTGGVIWLATPSKREAR